VGHYRDIAPYQVELIDSPEILRRTHHRDLRSFRNGATSSIIGGVAVYREVVAHVLAQHAGSKRTKALKLILMFICGCICGLP
jgi:hypothetical protein